MGLNNQFTEEEIKKMGMIAGIIWFIFFMLLFITFLVLKLTGVVAWSWIWVTAPFWIPCAIGFVLNCFGIGPK